MPTYAHTHTRANLAQQSINFPACVGGNWSTQKRPIQARLEHANFIDIISWLRFKLNIPVLQGESTNRKVTVQEQPLGFGGGYVTTATPLEV